MSGRSVHLLMREAMRGNAQSLQDLYAQGVGRHRWEDLAKAEKAVQRVQREQERLRREQERALAKAERDQRALDRQRERENKEAAKGYAKDAVGFFTDSRGVVRPIKAPSGGNMRQWGGKDGVLWDPATGKPYLQDENGRLIEADPKKHGKTVLKDGSYYRALPGMKWEWLGYDKDNLKPDKKFATELRDRTRAVKEAAQQVSGELALANKDLSSDRARLSEVNRLLKQPKFLADTPERTALLQEKSSIEGGLKAKVDRQAQLEVEAYRSRAAVGDWIKKRDNMMAEHMATRSSAAVGPDSFPNTDRRPETAGTILGRLMVQQMLGAESVKMAGSDAVRPIGDVIADVSAAMLKEDVARLNAVNSAMGEALQQNAWNRGVERLKGREQADVARLSAETPIKMPADVAKRTGIDFVPPNWMTSEAIERQVTARLAGQDVVNLPKNWTLEGGKITANETEVDRLWGIKLPWTERTVAREIGTLRYNDYGVPYVELKEGVSPSFNSGDYYGGMPEFAAMPKEWREQFGADVIADGERMLKLSAQPHVATEVKVEVSAELGRRADRSMDELAENAWQGRKWDAERLRDTLDAWQNASDAERAELIAEIHPEQRGLAPKDRHLNPAALYASGQLSAQDARMVGKTAYGTDPGVPPVDLAFSAWAQSSDNPAAIELRRHAASRPELSLWRFAKDVLQVGPGAALARTGLVGAELMRVDSAKVYEAKGEFLTDFYRENRHRVDFDQASFAAARDEFMGGESTIPWALNGLNAALQNASASSAGLLWGLAKLTFDGVSGGRLLTDEERSLIGEQTMISMENFKRAALDRMPSSLGEALAMSFTPSYLFSERLRDKLWYGEKGGALQKAVTALITDIDRGVLTADGFAQHRRVIDEASREYARLGGFSRASYQFDIDDPRSAMGQALLAYKDTMNPAYAAMVHAGAVSSDLELGVQQAAAAYASNRGMISESDYFGPLHLAWRGGQVAPLTEMGVELASTVLTVGVGKALTVGVNMARGARAGHALNRFSRVVDDLGSFQARFAQAGTFSRKFGQELGAGQQAWNAAVTAGKQVGASGMSEFGEEFIQSFGTAGTSIGDALADGVVGFIGGIGLSSVHGGVGAALGQVQLARQDAARNRALEAFVADYNQQNAQSPITVEQARQAQAYQPTDQVTMLTARVRELMGEDLRVSDRVTELADARAGALAAGGSVVEIDAQMADVLGERMTLRRELTAAMLDVVGIREASISAVQDINGLGAEGELVDAAVRLVAGTPLSPSQERLLTEAGVYQSKAAGVMIVPDTLRNRVAALAPWIVKDYFGMTEAEQLAVAERAVADRVAAEASVASEPPPLPAETAAEPSKVSVAPKVVAPAGGKPKAEVGQTAVAPRRADVKGTSAATGGVYTFSAAYRPVGGSNVVRVSQRVRAGSEAEAEQKRERWLAGLARLGEVVESSPVEFVDESVGDAAGVPAESATDSSADAVFDQKPTAKTVVAMLEAALGAALSQSVLPFVLSKQLWTDGKGVFTDEKALELKASGVKLTRLPNPMALYKGEVLASLPQLANKLSQVAPNQRAAYLRSAWREEVVHYATLQVRTPAQLAEDWKRLPDEAKRRVVETYYLVRVAGAKGADWRSVEVDPMEAGAEFWRMYLTAKFEGATTEQTGFAAYVDSLAARDAGLAARLREVLQKVADWMRNELLGVLDGDVRAEFEGVAAAIEAKLRELDAGIAGGSAETSVVEPAASQSAPAQLAFVPADVSRSWTPQAVEAALKLAAAAFGYKIVDTGIDVGAVDRYGNTVNLGTQLYDKLVPGSELGRWIDNLANSSLHAEIAGRVTSPGLHRVWFGHDFASNLGDVVGEFGWSAIPSYVGQLLKDSLTPSGIPLPGVELLVHGGAVSDRAATDWLSLNIGEVFGGGVAFLGTWQLASQAKKGTLTRPRVVFATLGIGVKLVAGVLTAQPFLVLSGLADVAILVTNLDQVRAAFKKAADVAKTKPVTEAVADVAETGMGGAKKADSRPPPKPVVRSTPDGVRASAVRGDARPVVRGNRRVDDDGEAGAAPVSAGGGRPSGGSGGARVVLSVPKGQPPVVAAVAPRSAVANRTPVVAPVAEPEVKAPAAKEEAASGDGASATVASKPVVRRKRKESSDAELFADADAPKPVAVAVRASLPQLLTDDAELKAASDQEIADAIGKVMRAELVGVPKKQMEQAMLEFGREKQELIQRLEAELERRGAPPEGEGFYETDGPVQAADVTDWSIEALVALPTSEWGDTLRELQTELEHAYDSIVGLVDKYHAWRGEPSAALVAMGRQGVGERLMAVVKARRAQLESDFASMETEVEARLQRELRGDLDDQDAVEEQRSEIRGEVADEYESERERLTEMEGSLDRALRLPTKQGGFSMSNGVYATDAAGVERREFRGKGKRKAPPRGLPFAELQVAELADGTWISAGGWQSPTGGAGEPLTARRVYATRKEAVIAGLRSVAIGLLRYVDDRSLVRGGGITGAEAKWADDVRGWLLDEWGEAEGAMVDWSFVKSDAVIAAYIDENYSQAAFDRRRREAEAWQDERDWDMRGGRMDDENDGERGYGNLSDEEIEASQEGLKAFTVEWQKFAQDLEAVGGVDSLGWIEADAWSKRLDQLIEQEREKYTLWGPDWQRSQQLVGDLNMELYRRSRKMAFEMLERDGVMAMAQQAAGDLDLMRDIFGAIDELVNKRQRELRISVTVGERDGGGSQSLGVTGPKERKRILDEIQHAHGQEEMRRMRRLFDEYDEVHADFEQRLGADYSSRWENDRGGDDAGLADEEGADFDDIDDADAETDETAAAWRAFLEENGVPEDQSQDMADSVVVDSEGEAVGKDAATDIAKFLLPMGGDFVNSLMSASADSKIVDKLVADRIKKLRLDGKKARTPRQLDDGMAAVFRAMGVLVKAQAKQKGGQQDLFLGAAAPVVMEQMQLFSPSMAPEVRDLVSDNLGLASYHANRYQNVPNVQFDDLQQEAFIGLMRAAETFDADRGTPFGAYATRVIKNRLNNAFRNAVRRAKVERVTLDEELPGREGETAKDQVVAGGPDVTEGADLAVLDEVLGALPSRMRRIVQLMAEGKNWREIGPEVGLSHEGARKAAMATMAQMRRELERRGVTRVGDILNVEARERATATGGFELDDESEMPLLGTAAAAEAHRLAGEELNLVQGEARVVARIRQTNGAVPPKGPLRERLSEFYHKWFRGRLDKLDFYAPGMKAALLDSARDKALATAAVNAMMAQIWESVQKSFGYPKFWAKNRRRLDAFVNELLPVAARLEVSALDENGAFIWKPFKMRVGTINASELKGVKVGERIKTRKGEFEVGDRVGETEKHILVRNVTAAEQQQIYAAFWRKYPEAASVLDRWIMPGMEKARFVHADGTETAEFNRYALRDLYNEWPEEFKELYGGVSLDELPYVDGYTPDVMQARTLVGIVVALLNEFRSPGRKFKAGWVRESGNVRNLLDGFSIRTMQGHLEKIRVQERARLIEAASVRPDSLTADNRDQYVPLDEVFMRLMAAVRLGERLTDRRAVEAVKTMDIGSEEKLVEVFGDAFRLYGRGMMVHKAVAHELMLGAARQATNNVLTRILNFLLERYSSGLIATGFSLVSNWASNELVLKPVRAANRLFYAALQAAAGDRRSAEIAAREAMHILRGAVMDRSIMPGAKARLGELVTREVFDDQTALEAVGVDRNVGIRDQLARLNVGGAFLQAVGYGDIDVRQKTQLAYAAYRAHAEVALKEAVADGSAKANMSAPERMAWMKKWVKAQPAAFHRDVYMTTVLYLMDYQNVPALLDAGQSNSGWAQVVKRGIAPFAKWPYNMLKQMKRLSLDSAMDFVLPGRTKEQRRNGAANLMVLGGMAGVGAVIAGFEDEDDPIFGSNWDEDGKLRVAEARTGNRLNLSRVGRVIAAHAQMRDVDLQSEDGGADGKDIYWRYRNYPYLKEALVMGLFANGEGQRGKEALFDVVDEYITTGILVKLVGMDSWDKGKRDDFRLTEAVYDLMASPVAPKPWRAFAVRAVDPVVRRTRPSPSMGYEGGVLDAIKVNTPGLSKSVPAAGRYRESALAPFSAEEWFKGEAERIGRNKNMTDEQKALAVEGLRGELRSMDARSAEEQLDVIRRAGLPVDRLGSGGGSMRELASDIDRLRGIGVGPESWRMNDRGRVVMVMPDSVPTRPVGLELLRFFGGANIKMVPPELIRGGND